MCAASPRGAFTTAGRQDGLELGGGLEPQHDKRIDNAVAAAGDTLGGGGGCWPLVCLRLKL